MPYKDPEKNRERNREYYQRNKQKEKERKAVYYDLNKEKIGERVKKYREDNVDKVKEFQKKYNQSPEGIKSRKMSDWRCLGVNNVNDELYEYYCNVKNCEACGNEFKSSLDKHLDHDHETGNFRRVLCCRCNVMDNWKKYVE